MAELAYTQPKFATNPCHLPNSLQIILLTKKGRTQQPPIHFVKAYYSKTLLGSAVTKTHLLILGIYILVSNTEENIMKKTVCQ